MSERWDHQEVAVLRRHHRRKTVWEMAGILQGRMPSAVYSKCVALGLRASIRGAPKVPCVGCGKLRSMDVRSRTVCKGCRPSLPLPPPPRKAEALPPIVPPPAHPDERLLARARQLGECLASGPATIRALVRLHGWTPDAVMAILGECPAGWFGVCRAGSLSLTPEGREALRVGLPEGGE
jgi:hypothetical protein